jgi:folate-binding protein YgfZ
LPVAGAEITDAHNPWEANLDADISLAKGCYNGQEVVARLHSYAKIKQRLRGLKLPAGSNAEDFRNAALQRNNREVGRISSAVVSPTLGPIALAYVREDAFEPGGTVQVLAHDGEAAATMLALPFE